MHNCKGGCMIPRCQALGHGSRTVHVEEDMQIWSHFQQLLLDDAHLVCALEK